MSPAPRELSDEEVFGTRPLTDEQVMKPAADPYSWGNTAARVGTSALMGVPDLAVGISNAARRYAGTPEDPYPGTLLRGALGIAERPADAGITRSLLEDAASVLVGGGGNAIAGAYRAAPTIAGAIWPMLRKFGSTVAMPTVGGQVGGTVGEAAAKAFNLDPQTGALFGSILGGMSGAVPQGYSRYSHNWYANRAKPEAGEIAAAMQRLGGTATPGMLGNTRIRDMELQLGGSTGGKEIIERPRQAAHDVIGAALDRLANERGTMTEPAQLTYPGPYRPPPERISTTSDVVTPGTVGDRARVIARDTAEHLRQGSDAAQARLMDKVGAETPVPLRPLQDAGANLLRPGSGLGPADRVNIEHRLGPALEAILLRDRSDARDPAVMFNPQTGLPTTESPLLGRNGGPRLTPEGYADRGSPAAPYADVKGYRTELGQNLETANGRLGPAAQLYGPTTEAMRLTAERRGVPRQDFENAMERTRQVETQDPPRLGDPIGDYHELAKIAEKDSLEAYDFLEKGRQNAADLGMIEATGHPEVPGLMGDILKLIGRETINNPNFGAAGPRQLATALEDLRPETRSILYGDQAAGLNDVATAARAFNYPTSQTGLTRATGGAADRTVAAINAGTALSRLGGTVGSLISLVAPPFINKMRAEGLNSPAARNALLGGEAPPMANIADLAAAMTAASAAAQERRPTVLPPITVEP